MNLSDIIIFKNGTKHFDLTNTIQYLQYKGRTMFGPHFRIHPADYEIVYKLLIWIVQDQENCEKHGLSLQKGILLSGPVGCGKSSLMKIVTMLLSKERTFIFKPAREICIEFSKNGYDVIHKYSRTARIAKAICLDDLGVEPPMRYFGDSINVLGELLLSRYELFVSKGILTHATTNLNAQEMEEKYGNRVRSRLREMFNLIAFPDTAMDKRC